MFTPPVFDESRLDILHDAIDRAGLATLVTIGDGLEATHLPLVLDPTEGEYGTLYGHMARANPQATAGQALAIFTGPDAYVTPSWYPSKAQTGKVVPTWNYVAVHATGDLEVFDDPDALLAVVTKLTAKHEADRAQPWAVTDAPPDFIAAHLKNIIGIRLSIARLQGKWKMSQNRSPADRQGVIDGLTEAGENAVVAAMAAEE
jgi:transcriptional regulator